MAQPHDLNSAQLAVPRWIANGSPSGVVEGYSHRISAVAALTRSGQDLRARLDVEPDSKPEDSLELARPTPKINVPATLRGAHRFVLATRDAAVGHSPGDDGRIQIGPDPSVAYTVVARENLNRALRILQAVLREATDRGWDVVSHDTPSYYDHLGIAIELRGHRYPIELYELTETIPFTEDEITAWRTEWTWHRESRAGQMPPPQLKRKRATGRLRLSLPHGYGGGRANWTEGPRGSLETKLPRVFRALEERLFAEAQTWHEVKLARRYIVALRNRLTDLPKTEQERLAALCDWCAGWIAQNDPVANTDRIVGLDAPDETY